MVGVYLVLVGVYIEVYPILVGVYIEVYPSEGRGLYRGLPKTG